MGTKQNDPQVIGRTVFLWTVASAVAFAASAWFLTS